MHSVVLSDSPAEKLQRPGSVQLPTRVINVLINGAEPLVGDGVELGSVQLLEVLVEVLVRQVAACKYALDDSRGAWVRLIMEPAVLLLLLEELEEALETHPGRWAADKTFPR